MKTKSTRNKGTAAIQVARNTTPSPSSPILPHDALLPPVLGSLGVPADERTAEAHRWRSLFQGALNVASNPHATFKAIEIGKKTSAWKRLTKPNGEFFASFGEFCSFESPHGLGTPEHVVIAFLYRHLSPRAVTMIQTAPARQGFRSDLAPPANDDGMSPRMRRSILVFSFSSCLPGRPGSAVARSSG